MKHRLIRLIALTTVTALFTTGCMMSRLVDRAFLGITVRRPAFVDRKTTGIFLLPFTFVIDAATFPIQALLVVILGDQFPFNDPPDAIHNMQTMLDENERYQQLGESEKKIAKLELEQLILEKRLTPNTALGLGDDGHWTLVELSADTRQQLIARATGFSPAAPPANKGFSPAQPEELACR